MPWYGDTYVCKPGRPTLGITKKVSITLAEEDWIKLEQLKKDSRCGSQSELLRNIIKNVID